MEVETLKICVSDYVIMGKVEKPDRPRIARKIPVIKRIFEILNIMFVGSNILSRPPTYTFEDFLFEASFD